LDLIHKKILMIEDKIKGNTLFINFKRNLI
jgi:hypothetical protein